MPTIVFYPVWKYQNTVSQYKVFWLVFTYEKFILATICSNHESLGKQ